MSDEWFSGQAPNIAYEDPLCRWAYTYAHVPVNANLFERVIEQCASSREAFRAELHEEEISVLVFGGGPGTELLGLAKYFSKQAEEKGDDHSQVEVDIDIVDRVPAW